MSSPFRKLRVITDRQLRGALTDHRLSLEVLWGVVVKHNRLFFYTHLAMGVLFILVLIEGLALIRYIL